MLTVEEYHNEIAKPTANTEEILKMEEYFKTISLYKEYAQEETLEYFTQYQNGMHYLSGVPEENQTPSMKRALQTAYDIFSCPSVLETRKQEETLQTEKAISLERKKQKTAGYTNGLAILFVVFNIGLFLATLLLYMK